MDEKEFERRAREALSRIEGALSAVEDEVDLDVSEGILTLHFEDGATFVVNSHSAARQIWLSANLAAAHFAWDGAAWRDTKTGAELYGHLGRLVGEKVGRAVEL